MVTLSGSPGLIVPLLNPRVVRLVTEAVVSIQSTILPFTFLSATESTMLACGLTKFNFLSLPSHDHLFIQVVHAGDGMMGLQDRASGDEAGRQNCAQDDASSDSCAHLIAPLR